MSKGRRLYDRMRLRARERLPRLVERQRNQCFFCKKEIVCERAIPVARRVSVTAHWITYLDETGQELKYLRATTEHVQPLSQGGDNRWNNLVAACAKCNAQRAKQDKMPKNKHCRKCGVRTSRGRHCKVCFREMVEEYFARSKTIIDTAPEFGQRLNLPL